MSKRIECEKCDGKMKADSYKEDPGFFKGLFHFVGSICTFGIAVVTALFAWAGYQEAMRVGSEDLTAVIAFTITSGIFLVITFMSSNEDVPIVKCVDCGHYYEVK
jgi:hypothetical protein